MHSWMEAYQPSGPNVTQTGPGSASAAEPGFNPPARWKLGRWLGSGGQAEVWLARDLELGEWVAVKVFHSDLAPTTRERLRREVRLGRTLHHPNLVRLFELIEADGRLAVVMEWVPGGSVGARLDAGPLPVDEVVRIADETLAALEYLHAHGVVHRDVKPSNLLLDEAGRVRLADLGLARPLEDASDLTKTNTTVGTPAFMSPEQIRGETPRPATDLYGLGITLFQLLTGGLPFAGKSQFEVATQHLAVPVRDPRGLRPECPRWLARFVLRLLEKRPEDRWRDAAAARQALHRRAGLTSPRVRRRAALVVAAVLGAAAVAAVVGPRVVRTWWHPAAVTVEASGEEVRGLDARGDVIWRRALEFPVRQVQAADLDGDGRSDTIVTAWPGTTSRTAATQLSEVLVLDPRGALVTQVHPEELLSSWPFDYPKSFTPSAKVLGIGNGGAPALLVNDRQRGFYPTVLTVYWPHSGVWEPILYHPGWIYDLAALPGTTPARLRFEGVNNRLGMYPVVGELMVRQPEPRSVAVDRFIDLTQGLQQPPEIGYRLTWYTLLDVDGGEQGTLQLAADGRTVIHFPGATETVDRFGNPVPGPNQGRDLRAMRTGFLEQLYWFSAYNQPVTPAGVRAMLARLRDSTRALFAERPYRVVAATATARALARAGDPAGAMRLLEQARAGGSAADATYWLANLEAISGDVAGAQRLAQEVVDSGQWTRRYDAAQLLLRLGAEQHDETGYRKAIVALGLMAADREMADRLAEDGGVRARLWWDELQGSDTRVGSSQFVPEGAALACLARWRLGRTAPGDPEAMVEAERINPDAALECRVARGAALLGLGRANDAAALLGQVVALLRPLAEGSFADRQTLELATALHVKAMLASGDRARALAEAQAVRPQLRPGLLPRILVDEVLRGAGGATRE